MTKRKKRKPPPKQIPYGKYKPAAMHHNVYGADDFEGVIAKTDCGLSGFALMSSHGFEDSDRKIKFWATREWSEVNCKSCLKLRKKK